VTASPHDALFKAAFSQVELAAEELRCVLPPALVARMDLSKLSLEAGSFVDEALRSRHTDLLYTVPLDGRLARIYVLFEHQSTPERWMALRLLGYMLRIWDSCLESNPDHLPVIIPVVLHHSDAGWRAPTSFEALVDPPPEAAPFTPHFSFALDDLGLHSDAALRERAASAFTRLVLLALQQTRGASDVTRLLNSWSDLINELLRAPDGRSALTLILRYTMAVLGPDAFAAINTTAIEIDKRGKQIMESMAEFLHRTGRNEGRNEGRRELLVRLVERRFGELPPSAHDHIASADDPTLERWADRLFTAQTLADLLGP
jgi:predicted transposase/invertase (TIGR01784 family)